jgi:hypothetical protein
MAAKPKRRAASSGGAAPTRTQTQYVVLELVEVNGGEYQAWREAGRNTASSILNAIKQHVGEGVQEGTFVAVPARSFVPKVLRVETKRQVLFV